LPQRFHFFGVPTDTHEQAFPRPTFDLHEEVDGLLGNGLFDNQLSSWISLSNLESL